MSQQPTGFLPSKSPGHPADINKPITGQIHDPSTDSGFKRTGSWAEVGHVSGFEGSYFQSNTTNDTIILRYMGASFWIRWYTDSASGEVEVAYSEDDGVTWTTVTSALDLYNANAGFRFTPFGFSLPRKQRLVRIRVTGNKNALSTDMYVKIDMIMSEDEVGLHHVIALAEETVPTSIVGALPFLLTGWVTASSVLAHLHWGLL